MGELPLIYVRGYAGTQSEVEATVDDPFYGFNLGSTHIRAGQDGHAQFYPFPSPLLRLMSEYGYVQVYKAFDSVEQAPGPTSIWIYRFYDPTSASFEQPGGRRLSIEEAAAGLGKLIDDVLQKTEAARVNLVAHSMGGLICRCLLQKQYPEAGKNPHDYVSRLFTFGTPHGGIRFDLGAGVLEKIRDALGVNDSDVFGPDKMYRYLTPFPQPELPQDFDARQVPPPPEGGGMLDPDRVFSVVGTNAADYDVAHGLSRSLVGPESDGLVQIKNAYVLGSHRAYIHRSHSGRYGMVNSEEAWQNLERFLFGDLKVKAVLCDFTLDFSSTDGAEITYFVETAIGVRGLPMLMHERSMANNSAESLNASQFAAQRNVGLPLFTNFLISRKARNGAVRYMLRIAVYRQSYKAGFLSFGEHIERLPVWSDYLIVELFDDPALPGDINRLRYSWSSESTEPTNEMAPQPGEEGVYTYKVELTERGKRILGDSAHVSFQASDWG